MILSNVFLDTHLAVGLDDSELEFYTCAALLF